MKIKELDIKYFRHMQDLNIKVGNSITVVSGLNGTGKSSLLGLIGHLFSFQGNKEDSDEKYPYKTISGQPFETEYSNIFRFSKEYDMDKKYAYKMLIENDDEDKKDEYIYGNSRWVEKENRYRMYVGQKEGQHGKKYTSPVIYLGLKRLYPIVDEMEEKYQIQHSELNEKETNEFISFTKNVLVSMDKAIASDNVITAHRTYEAIKSEKYNVESLSAGQDDISQIITALLSFERLKNRNGGVLLIDELDATLFPAAQINLVKQLYAYSKKLNIQIIFTTHSLEIIQEVQRLNKDECVVNFLEMKGGYVQVKGNPSFEYIKNRILMETKQKVEAKKINILCEDNTAYYWIYNLLHGNPFLKKHCVVYPGELSQGALANMAAKKLKCFQDFVFILDGDQRNEKKFTKIPNIMFVPGNKSPDSEIFLYLYSLEDDDEFWNNEELFFKDTCFNGYIDTRNENKHKEWLAQNENHLGRCYCKFFTRWKKDNPKIVKNFQEELEKIVKAKLEKMGEADAE